jgi:predicted nucleic acid-binding protein
MSGAVPYLLDTNVVLITTRQGNPAAEVIAQQFQLRASSFRPAICEVSVGELLAFAHSWGAARRKLLDTVIDELLLLPIAPRAVHTEWAKLRSYSKSHGLPIQHDHNDLWIAATANVAGMTVITSDASGFRPIRDAGLVQAELVDPKSGQRIA